MSQETIRKEIRACNRDFSCSARNQLFRLQFRGAREHQLKSDNDSPSAGTIPASSLPHFLALFASRIINLMSEMWGTTVEVDWAEISQYLRV